jgi:hypothetical protein
MNTTLSIDNLTAEKELASWVEYKKIGASKIEEMRTQPGNAYDNIIKDIQAGYISIDTETFVISQKLHFPVKATNGQELFSTLEFKPRVTQGDFQKATTQFSFADMEGRVMAAIMCSTGKLKAEIEKLDIEDIRVSKNIATFFL